MSGEKLTALQLAKEFGFTVEYVEVCLKGATGDKQQRTLLRLQRCWKREVESQKHKK